MRTSVLGLLLLAASCSATDLQSLYDEKQLFDLRDAVAAAEAPPFFRAAVACSFQDEEHCLAESRAFLNSNPPQDLAVKMNEVLFGFHLARGRWSEALAAMEAQVALKGDSEDPNNLREMCRAFLRHGPMSVERSAHSRIRVLHKNAHVPFTVNGRRYRAYVDTGANISMISESAAKQLGLSIETAKFRFFGAAGKSLPLTQVTVAERLAIGNVELRNVPFVVISDRQEPFVSWGSGKRCILGLQVLLAARNMTWKGRFLGATLELARPAGVRDLRKANFCFDGATPLAAAEFEGKRLTMFFDSGAGGSVLRANFAKMFPKAIDGVKRRDEYFQGIDGGAKAESAIVPMVLLRVDGREASFRRMPVYLKGHGADSHDGMFGNDLTRKTHEFTVDFEAMRLIMR